MDSGQLKIIGSNIIKHAVLPFSSQYEYVCSNTDITRGMTTAPYTISECFSRFPSIKAIANLMGFTGGYSIPGVTGTTFYNLWTGPGTGFTGPALPLSSNPSPHAGITAPKGAPKDAYLHDASSECNEIYGASGATGLGDGWLGCLWGTPEASFSCICPEIQPKFEAYLKLRLNVATFWNTPKATPVKRIEFLDEFKYGPKTEIVIPGDFNIKLGQVVELSVDGASGYPYDSVNSILNSKYWVIGIKHVLTNGGTHETFLILSKNAKSTNWSATGTVLLDTTEAVSPIAIGGGAPPIEA